MQDWDESYDFVIVGSGGASMCAALVAKSLGKKPLIIEKLDKVGGSTGFSGGVWWIPNNPVMKRAGVADSYERARQYLDAVASYHGAGSSDARRTAFLNTGPEMVEFLERAGMAFQYADGWSDYYDTLPGGEPRGRSLVAPLFDINELGEWKSRLSMYPGAAHADGLGGFSDPVSGQAHLGGQAHGAEARLAHALRETHRQGPARQWRRDPGSHAANRAARAIADLDTTRPYVDLIVNEGRVDGCARDARGPQAPRARARWGAHQRRRLLAQSGDARGVSGASPTLGAGPTPTPATPAR